MEDRICDLEADLRTMSRLKPVAAVNYIRKVIGYDDYLESYAEFRRNETGGTFRDSGQAGGECGGV